MDWLPGFRVVEIISRSGFKVCFLHYLTIEERSCSTNCHFVADSKYK